MNERKIFLSSERFVSDIWYIRSYSLPLSQQPITYLPQKSHRGQSRLKNNGPLPQGILTRSPAPNPGPLVFSSCRASNPAGSELTQFPQSWPRKFILDLGFPLLWPQQSPWSWLEISPFPDPWNPTFATGVWQEPSPGSG